MKDYREFSIVERDENGVVYHDMLFEEYDGKAEKVWDWFNDGRTITVISRLNRDKHGRRYETVHQYDAGGYVHSLSKERSEEQRARKHLAMLVESARRAISNTPQEQTFRRENLIRTMEKWVSNNVRYKHTEEYVILEKIVADYRNLG